MTVASLLADLKARGVTLLARDDKLWYRPQSAVPPELVDLLRQFKTELFGILPHRGNGADDPAPDAGRTSTTALAQSRYKTGEKSRGGSGQQPEVGGGRSDPATETSSVTSVSDNELVADNTADWQEVVNPDGSVSLIRLDVIDQEVVEIHECTECGGVLAWWDIVGRRHCQACEPRRAAAALRKRAAYLRAKYARTSKEQKKADRSIGFQSTVEGEGQKERRDFTSD